MAAVTITTMLLLAVLASTLFLLGLGARRRILLRIGLRNIARKRSQVAMAIAGLLVSTSIISGSFVFSDSWRATLENFAIRSLDVTDETITRVEITGLLGFFPYSAYQDLTLALPSMPHVAAIAPRIIIPAAVNDDTSQLFRAQTTLVGYDAARDLGEFIPQSGSVPTGPLGPHGAILNNRLAERMDARVGDNLTVFLGLPHSFTVTAIVGDRGRGGWMSDEDIFVDLGVAQLLTGQPDRINYILVANVGGATGYEVSAEATTELSTALGSTYHIVEAKKVGIDQATTQANSLSQLFVVLSSFSIISGLLLIVSIFVMLAEERKTEMGIARALGMRRSHLVQAFVLEGFVYALVSAALGAAAGVGLGAAIIWIFGLIFPFVAEFVVITLLPSSLLLAFAIGALITLGTITGTSWYVSRLNIVRAIRAIPEPVPRRSTWRQLLIGVVCLGWGLTLTAVAFPWNSNLALTTGIALAALGVAALLLRVVNRRVLLTATGIFMLAWLLKPFSLIQSSIEIQGFIVVGVLLVLAGVILAMANSQAMLAAVTALVKRRRRLLPVVRTAIAYPMNRQFRTSMSLAMFALIIFTITTLAMFQALFGTSVAAFTQEFSGSYEIGGFSNPLLRADNFSAQLASNASLAGRLAYHEELVLGRIQAKSEAMNRSIPYGLVGVNANFTIRNRFTFRALAPGYATPQEAWQAILGDPGLAVVDGSTQPSNFGPEVELPVTLGGTVQLAAGAGTPRTVKIIGIMDQALTQAVYVAPQVPRDLLNATAPSLFYFKVAAGQDASAVAKDLERLFLNINLQAFVFEDLIRESIQSTFNFFYLLQGFLGLGLVVGIAGLGVITMRNVAERKNVMGALRALGFRRSMVLEAFLMESSFVALLGTAIGTALGIGLAYRLRDQIEFLSHGTFVIPWPNLLLVIGIAYGASLLATFSPARSAARMPPAEALRITE